MKCNKLETDYIFILMNYKFCSTGSIWKSGIPNPTRGRTIECQWPQTYDSVACPALAELMIGDQSFNAKNNIKIQNADQPTTMLKKINVTNM